MLYEIRAGPLEHSETTVERTIDIGLAQFDPMATIPMDCERSAEDTAEIFTVESEMETPGLAAAELAQTLLMPKTSRAATWISTLEPLLMATGPAL